MSDNKHDDNDNMVECSVCLKEIPKSEAKIAEAQDYVQHFCGLECYQKWHEHKHQHHEKDLD